jgi:hypothetical protein
VVRSAILYAQFCRRFGEILRKIDFAVRRVA